jgi:hypothetical protein
MHKIIITKKWVNVLTIFFLAYMLGIGYLAIKTLNIHFTHFHKQVLVQIESHPLYIILLIFSLLVMLLNLYLVERCFILIDECNNKPKFRSFLGLNYTCLIFFGIVCCSFFLPASFNALSNIISI